MTLCDNEHDGTKPIQREEGIYSDDDPRMVASQENFRKIIQKFYSN